MITKPKFDESVFVCPGAAIVGDVTLGKNVNAVSYTHLTLPTT